jgi:hypothetical protein
MKVMKRVDPALLQQELTAAGVPYRNMAAWLTDVPGETNVVDHDDNGFQIEPVPEATPVINAHVAPPRVVEYANTKEINSIVRTTDDIPMEVFRFSTEVKHVYTATFSMIAIDATSGATKKTSAEMVFKRQGNTLTQVGSTYVPATFQDAAAASWQIQPLVQVTDLVISVRGASGRTIDWLMTGNIGAYAPGGLTSPEGQLWVPPGV